MSLHFDEGTHTYILNGRVLPSVTQVLERTGIVDYSFIPPRTRQMALERGSAVHASIALDLEGDLDEASVEPLMGYVEAARAVRHDLGITTPDTFEERRHCPRYLYAGTVDLIFADILLDWKTNSAEWWVRLQTAAYAGMFGGGKFRRIAAELHADGTYRLETFKASNFTRDFNDFLCCLRVVQMVDEHDKRKTRAAA